MHVGHLTSSLRAFCLSAGAKEPPPRPALQSDLVKSVRASGPGTAAWPVTASFW